MITPVPGCYNQAAWPGVGDVDDCWVITPLWCAVASGASAKVNLPSVYAFRAKAGNPDEQGVSDGGTNAQALVAVKALLPNARAYSLIGTLADVQKVLAAGEVMSLSVVSGKLPTALQFGFTGNHQIGVVKVGASVLVMNPLNKQGAPLQSISWTALAAAATALYNDGKFHAVMFRGPLPPPVVVTPPPVVVVPPPVVDWESKYNALVVSSTAALASLDAELRAAVGAAAAAQNAASAAEAKTADVQSALAVAQNMIDAARQALA